MTGLQSHTPLSATKSTASNHAVQLGATAHRSTYLSLFLIGPNVYQQRG